MIELKGKYNKDCKIFTDEVETEAISLLQSILDKKATDNVPVRIMPDVHAGKGVTVGFTMPLSNLLSPAWIGVDIGCGMISASFPGRTSMDLEKVDKKIRERVPTGFSTHDSPVFHNIPFNDVQIIADHFTIKFNEKFGTNYVAPKYNDKWLNNKLKDIDLEPKKFWNSIGTLGGGNHFLEIGKSDKTNDYWVTIHCGSRNFGLKIAKYHLNIANSVVKDTPKEYTDKLEKIKSETPKNLIKIETEKLREEYGLGVQKEFLFGENLINYLHDMIFAQQYAIWNRETILKQVKKAINIKSFGEIIETTHNYVDFKDFIIRKGAIASYEGEKMIIPFNMRDGILLCEGKSNPDWNFSAPHGSGRLMSRSKAKDTIDYKNYKRTMKDVYSTSVTKSTIDESPFAYKSTEMIENSIGDTATIIEKIKPVLNIKDTGGISITEKKERKEKDYKRKKERREVSHRKMKKY